MHLDAPTLTLVAVALANLCGLVWGAAKIDTSVKTLNEWSRQATQQLARHDEKIGDHETRITVLEDREERP